MSQPLPRWVVYAIGVMFALLVASFIAGRVDSLNDSETRQFADEAEKNYLRYECNKGNQEACSNLQNLN